MERIGLRLQLRKQQAEAGDIVLLYGDESEALTHPYLARAWAKSGADLRVPAPGQARKVAILGSLDHLTRRLIVHTSPTKRGSDFIAHLEQIDHLYGPQPGRQTKPVVLVEDNGPIHTSKQSLAALSARAHWLTIEWLPKYAPELNDIEPVWRDLKAHHLAHQTFADADALDRAIHHAVSDLNQERMTIPLAKSRISCLGPRSPLNPIQPPSKGHALNAAMARQIAAERGLCPLQPLGVYGPPDTWGHSSEGSMYAGHHGRRRLGLGEWAFSGSAATILPASSRQASRSPRIASSICRNRVTSTSNGVTQVALLSVALANAPWRASSRASCRGVGGNTRNNSAGSTSICAVWVHVALIRPDFNAR